MKNHKSEEGDFAPVRKGRVEEAESNTETEEGVKMAKPLGRRKGDRPTRECERAKSGKKYVHLQDRAVMQGKGDDG